MDAKKEVVTAKTNIVIWPVILIIGILYLLPSLASLAQDFITRALADFVHHIYTNTQIPILVSIWETAPRPDFSNIFQLKNFTFFVLVFLVALGFIKTGSSIRTLDAHADSKHRVKQSKLDDFYKK